MNSEPVTIHPPRDTSWISLVLIFMILFVGGASVVGVFQVKRQRARADRRERARLAAEREVQLLRGEAAELQPEGPEASPAGSTKALALGYISLGDNSLAAGDVEKARRCFKQASLEDERVLPFVWIGYAKVELATGNYDTALALLAHALDALPNHPEALLLRAKANLGLGDDSGAIKDLEALPSSPERDALLEKAKKSPDNP